MKLIVIVRSHTVLVLKCDINQVVQATLCIDNRFGICLSYTAFIWSVNTVQIKIQRKFKSLKGK